MFKRLEVDDWKALMDHAIDPYLVWSDLTGFRQFRSPASGIEVKSLPFLVELREPYDPAEQIGLKIHKLFEAPLADGKRAHFVTTRIDVPTDEIDSPLPKLIRNEAVDTGPDGVSGFRTNSRATTEFVADHTVSDSTQVGLPCHSRRHGRWVRVCARSVQDCRPP